VSVEVIVAIAFGLAGIIVSIGAIIFTMKQQYIHIRGKSRQEYFSHCTNFMAVDTADIERQYPPRESEPPHAAAIRILEVVLWTGWTGMHHTLSNARNSIELEDQSSQG
jgi:hypothetical protein